MEEALDNPHPYSPRDLHLPGYVLVLLSPSTIICVYIAASLIVTAFVWGISGKEYSRSDSRYAAWDSVIVSKEIIVVLMVGPACLLAAYTIATEKAYSCMLQFVVSLAHLYGTALYFLSAYVEGDHFASSTYYYYAYYAFTNAPWLVIPSLIEIHCWKKASATAITQGQNKAKSS